MKSKGHGAQNIPVGISDLYIPVNGFGNADNLDIIFDHFLGKKCRIGVGIIPPDNDKGVQPQTFAGLF